jgi:hypothetical protein
LHRLDRDGLIEALMRECSQEDFMKAVDDVSATEELRNDEQMVTTLGAILAEIDAPEDDPRHKQVAEAQTRVMAARMDAMARRTKERQDELAAWTPEALIEDVVERWVSRLSFAEFLAENAAAELFFAIRECEATKNAQGLWDHENCDHSKRLCATRKETRNLPDHVLTACRQALDQITIGPREAGKSEGLATSSGSSRPARRPEGSSPSIPVETSAEPAGA